MTKIALLLIFLIFPIATNSADTCPRNNPELPLMINGYYLVAELAIDNQSRQCGLSLRDSLPPDRGMLFIYRFRQAMAFWMKDTKIPLSIAFLNSNGIVINIEDMVPMDTKTIIRSLRPARYALEMNKDWFLLHDLKVGDYVHIKLPGNILIE